MAFVLCFHLIPPLLLWVWTTLLRNSIDPNLTNFIAMWIWRYSRLFINMWFYMRYQPAYPPKMRTVYPKDVTVIIPTVFDPKTYASDLRECIKTCLLTHPAKIIVVTDTKANARTLQRLVTEIRHRLKLDDTFKGYNPHQTCDVPIQIEICPVSNKREQLAVGIRLVTTSLVLFLDDHVFLKPRFLDAVVCAFEDPLVGLCGTKKTVRRQAPEADSLWGWYWESFWNVMGALYLTRHNFEIRATNAADGGVFVVSGRALLVRANIVKDKEFLSRYTNERFFFGLLGPLAPDDDNFLTRWVTQHGWNIKIQYTDEATVETTLGQPNKFVAQCLRWARTTFRSNLCSLLTERTVWHRQPLTVWTTLIPSLFNLAFFWDFGMMHIFTKSKLYLESSNHRELLFCLWLWIYFAKSIKLMGYFWHHPQDFFLFFFPIPAYHLFAWFHSFVKLYSAATFYITSWTGRKVNNPTPSNSQQGMELSKPDTDQFGVRRISFAFAFAFAFDVDGVLVKGDKPIPGARETIKMLQEKHVPFILLTNGGGKTEEAHVASIGERLGVEVSKAQFIQSHSPYRELVPEYQDKNILVLGGYNNDIKNIATHYGFKKVITASDLQQYFQHIHPFPEMTEPKHKEIAEIPRGTLKHMLQREIAAILVFSSPRDWCGDLQLIIDILLSRGVGNTSLPDNGFIQDGQPKLYFCNPDLEWTTQHKFPRFAQGAFTSALEGVWQALTDGQVELKYSTIGKPTQKTFEYGETTLQEYNNRLNRENGTNNYIKTVYMIGDNPNSDIKGCNNYISPFGTNWKSVLVETGVYAAGSPPTHIPTHFACTCKDAVQWALLQEGHATGG